MSASGLYEVIDPRFSRKIHGNAKLDELYSGCRWAEGPVWFADHDCLYFSDIPNERVLRYSPADGTVTACFGPSNFANGHSRDRQGRLISCEHGPRRVTRREIDGTATVLADSYEGKRLNSPNDVVVKSDGSIWFTDPTYGIMSDYEGHAAEPEQALRGVYRIDGQDGSIRRMIDDFVQPNGLAFSPDESRLYVTESGASHDRAVPRHIRVFDVNADGQVGNGREFATIDKGLADGIRLDRDGWLWSSAAGGIEVFDETGQRVGRINIPQTVSNLCFGGAKGNRLYITATQSLYALYVNTRGANQA